MDWPGATVISPGVESVAGRQGLCCESGHEGGHAARSFVRGGAVSGDVEDTGLTTSGARDHDVAVFHGLAGGDGDLARAEPVAGEATARAKDR